MNNRVTYGIVIFMQCALFSWAGTGAYNNDLLDARSLGNLNAVAARADSPATNWFNPAGLTKVEGTQFLWSYLFESAKFELESDAGPRVDAKTQRVNIPAFYLSMNPEGPFAFGAGIDAAYAFSSDWHDPITNYVSTFSEVMPLHLGLSGAFEFSDLFSFGLGLDFIFATATSEKKINLTGLNSVLTTAVTGIPSWIPSEDGESILEGEDEAIGFNLSALISPSEEVSIGLVYRPTIDLDFEGDISFSDLNGITSGIFGGSMYKTDASLSLPIPASFTMGIAYSFGKHTTAEIDVVWTKWSEVKNFHTKFNDELNPLRLQILNTGNPAPKNWDDVVSIALGIEHKLNDKVKLFGGVGYRPNPIPEDTFDTLVPPVDAIDYGGGICYRHKDFEFNLMLGFSDGFETEVRNGVGNQVGASINGKYDMEVRIIGLSVTYKK